MKHRDGEGMVETKLLLCPFPDQVNGDVRIQHRRQGDVYWVQCTACGARGSVSKTEAGAITAWNTRTPSHTVNGAAKERGGV